ncbi:mitochondrial 37S ribosomal protein [Martiniozyma asiatica (nom. inval.)]|nr:mitochondrial 37S ribosomal protein [Martiniozyma asiatica]
MNSVKSASQVLQRTSEYIGSGFLKQQPAWYPVMAQYPPQSASKKIRLDLLQKVKEEEVNHISMLTEKLDNGYYATKVKSNKSKNGGVASAIYRPQKLQFVEDELRELFYRQHPWELADPKVLVENEQTLDNDYIDWSHMRQFTRQLNGESVVQRTMYLIEKENLTILQAYEKSKYEYYQLKIQDETAMNVAREESDMFGAVYAKTHMEANFEAEGKVLETWKKEAVEQTEIFKAKLASMGSGAKTVEIESVDLSETDLLEQLEGEEDVEGEQRK